MDKKNTVIGIALLLAAFGAFFYAQKVSPPPAPASQSETLREPPPAAPVESAPTATQPSTGPAAPAISNGALATDTAAIAGLATDNDLQSVVSLGNDHVEVQFTDFGGAIREVGFLQYAAFKDNPAPYVFNQLRYAPALSFVNAPGIDHAERWELVEKSQRHVVYRAVADGRLEITRRYSLPGPGEEGDPYRIRAEMTLRNLGDAPIGAQRIALNLGTAEPVNANDTGYYLNIGHYDGEDDEFIGRGQLEGGGFLAWIGVRENPPRPFIDHSGTFQWASVKNQFFTSILTPDTPAVAVRARRVELPPFPDTTKPAVGITGDAMFDLPRIEAGASVELNAWFYVGPKEYDRLVNFEHREDLVMEFGFFGFFAKLLLTMLNWFHGMIPNYGIAIIITTLVLKTVFLPLTLSAAKSSKRMAKIQGPLKEIREKHKDNPQKMQKETLELFKQHKVNPLGGCLPILVTIPFFFGFFTMLQSSSEIRFAEFLWVTDLSAPDTVARIFGFPVNIMPLLMGASMVYQMRLTPTPTMDNAQAKMLKFMPYMMLVFCYTFSSALSLYWTVSNIYTIGQQLIINRMKDDLVIAAPVAVKTSPGGKKKKKR
ncbi:MAG TPA: membrane protein insertase YidC [Opitutaceae bacterium]|nr:membrane protein insertase YidC [Opitutaceae bacterium]